MPICSIVCGAPCSGIEPSALKGLVIAADRGLDVLLSAGMKPDIAVGDFDSAECAVPEGIECVRACPIKDFTDAQLAADIAVARGYDELVFHAALGGRLDHTIANIQMIYGLMERGVKSVLLGDGEKAYMLRGTARIPRFEGYLSVFAVGGQAVVSESGTKYTIERCAISETFPLGVSNEITAEKAVVTVHSGTALVIEHAGKG